jgi:hypothetical protein
VHDEAIFLPHIVIPIEGFSPNRGIQIFLPKQKYQKALLFNVDLSTRNELLGRDDENCGNLFFTVLKNLEKKGSGHRSPCNPLT